MITLAARTLHVRCMMRVPVLTRGGISSTTSQNPRCYHRLLSIAYNRSLMTSKFLVHGISKVFGVMTRAHTWLTTCLFRRGFRERLASDSRGRYLQRQGNP